MRHAVILAPSDPSSAESHAASDAVAWLGAALARVGFRVAVIDDGAEASGELARALERLSEGDSLLLHLSGELARKGVLRLANGQWFTLRAIGEALAQQKTPHVSVVAELAHEDDPADALVAADHVAAVVAAIGGRERGYSVVVAVRAANDDAAKPGALGFTRLLLDVAGRLPVDARTLSAVYERATAIPESVAAAQSFTFIRGQHELDFAPPPVAAEEVDALVARATDAGDWPRVLEIRRTKLGSLTGQRARVRELIAIARILQAELGDEEGAIEALEQARATDPLRVSVLQALRRGYAKLRRWASTSEVLGALAGLAESNAERAALRYAQARIALEHLEDEERAMAWLGAALRDDPEHDDAQAMLNTLRARNEAPALDADLTYDEPTVSAEEPVSERLVGPPTGENPAVPLAASAGRGQLLRPSDPPFEPSVVVQSGDALDSATHARAFEAHRQAARADAAFMSALALEDLGAADVDHKLFIEQLRSVAPLRVRGSMDDAAWALLRPPGSDDVLEAMFRAVSRAAIMARMEQLVARGRLVELDDGTRLEASSTASVVRSFQWAAQVIGVRCPELFVVDHVPGEIAAVRAHRPSTAVGPSVVRGRSAKDLAFLAGRHLTYYRPEHQVLVYFPTREELTRLFLATLQLTMPGVSNAVNSRAVGALCDRLQRLITPQELRAVAEAVLRLDARGGQVDLGAWTRAVELTGARTGLLLSGDLATAMSVMRAESREIAGLSSEAKREELIAFATSDAHLALRARFAVAMPETAAPLPPPSAMHAAPHV